MTLVKFALFFIAFCCSQSFAQENTAFDNYEDATDAYSPSEYDTNDANNEVESVGSGDQNSQAYDPCEYYNVTEEAEEALPIEKAMTGIYIIITIVGLVANLIVFFVIFAGNEIGKTVTTIYILQLTIADTIFLFTLPVFAFQKLSNKWHFGDGLCAFCQTIKFLNYYAGIFFLTAMSVDRYVAVAYSTRLTQIRTKFRTYCICAAVWVVAIIMSIPLMLYARLFNAGDRMLCKVMFPDPDNQVPIHEEENNYIDVYDDDCGSGMGALTLDYVVGDEDYSGQDVEDDLKYTCDFKDQPKSYIVWLTIDFIVGFLIPFMIIVAMYALILLHLKNAEDKIGHTATSRSSNTRKRVTKMVAALVVGFTICWLPHHLLTLIKIKGFETTIRGCHVTEEIFVALAFANSALNPILYTFMGNNFTDRFRRSVKNTQKAVKRRTSSRSSYHRRSGTNHSHPSNENKASAGLIVHYRKTSTNGSQKENSQNGKSKSSISLLGSKTDKNKTHSDLNSGDGSQKAENFYPATTATLLENTVEA